MEASDGALLQPCRTKTASPRSGGHGDDPRPSCHNVSVQPHAGDLFNGLLSSLVCEGVFPDLGLMDASLWFWRRNDGGGYRWWKTVWQGVNDSMDELVSFSVLGSFSQFFKVPKFLDVLFGFHV